MIRDFVINHRSRRQIYRDAFVSVMLERQGVVPAAAVKCVIAAIALDDIIGAAAGEGVVSVAADQVLDRGGCQDEGQHGHGVVAGNHLRSQ